MEKQRQAQEAKNNEFSNFKGQFDAANKKLDKTTADIEMWTEQLTDTAFADQKVKIQGFIDAANGTLAALRTAKTAAEKAFSSANEAKKKAAEAARAKKVDEAKDRDFKDAQEDKARFGKIKTKLDEDIVSLAAQVAGGKTALAPTLQKKRDTLAKVVALIGSSEGYVK